MSAEAKAAEAKPGGLARVASGLRRSRSAGSENLAEKLFVPAILLALGAYLSATNEYFLNADNIENIFIQASILAIVAFGVTFVVLAGEFDLSVGSGVALTSVVSALVMRDTGSIALGVGAAVVVGCLMGAINGLVVTRLEVPSFIATLGMLTIASGIALAAADGQAVTGVPDAIGELADSKFLGINYVIWLVFAVFAVLYFVQSQTTFGIRVFATGGNREAARLSGISVDRVRLAVFVISGLTVGIAGLSLTGRVESGQPNGGALLELDAVAAIVIGGTSLLGGRGSVVGTLWGVLFIATLRNGLDLEGVGDDLKSIIIGTVFILAASVDFFRRQMRQRRLRRIGREDTASESTEPSGKAGAGPPTSASSDMKSG